ncbi:sensor histidine kinase [endosymbiont of Ridgeia piscesae]|jgi:two-component system sensor histidine kinase AlgZ|uniref:Histidine kinase n=1 Tax=endosymbiont of Ridgeia piscesae TaxID=54398 RepID=A0A0T5ZAW4_9GAMM|nr:histidine kinase [endosymbiont of Ridgeia piscesae]KRT56161.1 Histidine kinase [endosymbiont of Ridgeia piscesae]KRT59991.1 two-component system, LytT family, sensor histidine kinase AlgZ [endosymbiont of Ridgeia piscesae]
MHQVERRDESKRQGTSDSGCFLPNFCSIRAVFGAVVTAELLALLLVLASATPLARFWTELSSLSLVVQWIALSSALLLCLLRPLLCRFGNRVAGVSAWLLLLLTTLLACEAARMLTSASYRPFDGADWEALLRYLGIAAIVGLLLLRYLYLQFLWRRQQQAESAARLQALQSRIRPHFLFNSMNTVASLTRTDPVLAERVVEDLADLFRAAFGDAQRDSTLGRELELARHYLNVERLRLGERLQLEWDLQDLPEAATLPALTLQPLIENAVYHGIEPAPEGGRIEIVGRYRHRRINLSIRNSLPPESAEKVREGNRLALENIRQRLAARFDTEASLIHSKVDGMYQVRLVIPYPWSET